MGNVEKLNCAYGVSKLVCIRLSNIEIGVFDVKKLVCMQLISWCVFDFQIQNVVELILVI